MTKLDWVNPRAFLFMNVRDAAGSVANWAVEFGNPLDLEKNGWKATSLKIGDVVTVEGILARGEARQASATSIVLKATGRRLFSPQPRSPARRCCAGSALAQWACQARPCRRRQGILGNSERESACGECHATKAAMNDDGLLANIADIDKVAPFKPWARAVYEYPPAHAAEETIPLDDVFLPAVRVSFRCPTAFNSSSNRNWAAFLFCIGGGNRNWRIIHTDGRPVGGSFRSCPQLLRNLGWTMGRRHAGRGFRRLQ